MSNFAEVEARLVAAGQGHVLAHMAVLSDEERAAFEAELAGVDAAGLQAAYERAVAAETATFSDAAAIAPLVAMVGEDAAGDEQMGAWESRGLAAVAAGKVAVVLLAGGQGTRLGSAQPKGCYVIGSPSGASLFQMQAERITKVEHLAAAAAGVDPAAVTIPWYIMTSAATDAPTRAFFADNAYFGRQPADVIFFPQGTLPCLTPEGKLICSSAGALARAPDGNGGIYAALANEGVLDDMAARGIEAVHTYCVDNCLAKVADPPFVGYCLDAGAKCGVKVIAKTEPDERVGVLALHNGVTRVLEYSELPAEMAAARNDDGSLVYSAANIVNHFYTLDFLREIVDTHLDSLVHHVAHKKIPHVSADGSSTITPDANNGVKLELFIFDVFPAAGDSIVVLQGHRDRDFAPLKNAPGASSCTPQHSVAALTALHTTWAHAAGATGTPDAFEISPLVSYAGEGLDNLAGVDLTSIPPLVAEL